LEAPRAGTGKQIPDGKSAREMHPILIPLDTDPDLLPTDTDCRRYSSVLVAV
jgi:hypothetical protein